MVLLYRAGSAEHTAEAVHDLVECASEFVAIGTGDDGLGAIDGDDHLPQGIPVDPRLFGAPLALAILRPSRTIGDGIYKFHTDGPLIILGFEYVIPGIAGARSCRQPGDRVFSLSGGRDSIHIVGWNGLADHGNQD